MYVPLTDADTDTLNDDVDKLLTDGVLKALKKAAEDALYPVWDNAVEALKSDTGSNYHDAARRAAAAMLDRVLDGDEDAARNLFEMTYDASRHHHLIRGHIHEPTGVKLRRMLVEAHADLLRDARIKDLEALVGNTTEENRNLQDRIYRLERGL